MPYSLNKMRDKNHPIRKVRFEDILFWIIILGIVAIALWLLHGSPTETGALISIATFVAASELLIWKFLFKSDKNTAIELMKVKESFTNVKHDIEKNQIKLTNKLNLIENNLNNRFDKIEKKL